MRTKEGTAGGELGMTEEGECVLSLRLTQKVVWYGSMKLPIVDSGPNE